MYVAFQRNDTKVWRVVQIYPVTLMKDASTLKSRKAFVNKIN